MPCPAPTADIPRRLHLPGTLQRPIKSSERYCKVLTAVLPQDTCCFEGKLYKPGELVDSADLPRPTVVLECLGQLGTWQRGKHREWGYVLWRYDYQRAEWKEIGRAQARDAAWIPMLKPAAYAALYPRPELVDVIGRSRDVADEIIELIDRRLAPEKGDVRRTALASIYEMVAGRMANCA